MPVSITVRCPACSTEVAVSADLRGRLIRCDRCGTRFAANEELPFAEEPEATVERPVRHDRPLRRPGPDPEVWDEDERPRRRSDRDEWAEEDRPRRRRALSSRDDSRRSRGAGTAIAVGLAAALGFAVIGVIAFLVVRDKGLFSAAEWKEFEEPNRCKALMPGKPERKSETANGFELISHKVEPNRHTAYAVAYSATTLPRHRLNLPMEALLNDACAGAVANLANMGGSEVSRTSIKLGPISGKELVVDVPKLKGKLIGRIFVHRGRLYMAMAVGRNFEPNHQDVKRFLDSFEIIEGDDKPAPKQEPKSNDPKGQFARDPNDPIAKDPKRSIAIDMNEPADIQIGELPDRTVLPPDRPDLLLADGGSAYLCELTELYLKEGAPGWKFARKGKMGKVPANDAELVRVNSMTPAHALTMHPPARDYTRVCYALGRRAQTLKGRVALSDDAAIGARPPTHFLVLGDGKVLWRSQAIDRHERTEEFSIDVRAVEMLELRVFIEAGEPAGCHAVWIDPVVTIK